MDKIDGDFCVCVKYVFKAGERNITGYLVFESYGGETGPAWQPDRERPSANSRRLRQSFLWILLPFSQSLTTSISQKLWRPPSRSIYTIHSAWGTPNLLPFPTNPSSEHPPPCPCPVLPPRRVHTEVTYVILSPLRPLRGASVLTITPLNSPVC